MTDTGLRYYITDTQGNYYKLNEKGSLVVAKNSTEASVFPIQEANSRIGTGRKARFYHLMRAEDFIADIVETLPDTEESYSAPEMEAFETPTMFDSLHNDWEGMLGNLCYMSDHMDEYQNNLKLMLSDVDKEVCDLMHYLEFNELDNDELIEASKMLQERRRRRREIKDEMEKTALMKSTFLDSGFSIKIQQSLEFMERMKSRQYTPRKLESLFQQHKATA